MKYQIFDNWNHDPGKWVSPKRAALTEKGWLHWELSDGTNALSPPSKKGIEWREKPKSKSLRQWDADRARKEPSKP